MNDDAFPLANFSGTVRLFPLPKVVLFPLAIQPLHIFEPRYRQMIEDALNDDRLIAMALYRPGWSLMDKDEGPPPIYAMACLGKIVVEQRLDDGRYNLFLQGLERVRIVQEIAQDKLYRSATVEVVSTQALADPVLTQVLRQQLATVVAPWFAEQAELLEQLQRLLDSDPDLGTLCDVLAFALPLPPRQKQKLLEEVDVAQRARSLVQQLQTPPPPKPEPKFPPDFSEN